MRCTAYLTVRAGAPGSLRLRIAAFRFLAVPCLLAGCAQGLLRAGVVWSDADLDFVLSKVVSTDGRVDYDGLKSDRAALDRYVEALARVSPDNHPELFPTEAHRLAYWMNAYNALMLHRVVDAWPVASVKDIRPAFGVFWMERHGLGGERWTLRGLENDVIRQRFRDPRIHFAINCASTSCPALANRAFRAEGLDAALEEAARRFIRNPANVRLDRTAGVVHLSSIFRWYEADFTGWLERKGIGHPHGALDYVVRYLREEEARVGNLEKLRVEWIDYDWSLNERE